MLQGKKLTEKLCLKTGDGEAVIEEGGGSTAKRITFEDRNELKSCCQNALTISAAIRLKPATERLVRTVVVVMAHLTNYHGEAARARDVDAMQEWYMKMLKGGYMQHVEKTRLCLGHPNS